MSDTAGVLDESSHHVHLSERNIYLLSLRGRVARVDRRIVPRCGFNLMLSGFTEPSTGSVKPEFGRWG